MKNEKWKMKNEKWKMKWRKVVIIYRKMLQVFSWNWNIIACYERIWKKRLMNVNGWRWRKDFIHIFVRESLHMKAKKMKYNGEDGYWDTLSVLCVYSVFLFVSSKLKTITESLNGWLEQVHCNTITISKSDLDYWTNIRNRSSPPYTERIKSRMPFRLYIVNPTYSFCNESSFSI